MRSRPLTATPLEAPGPGAASRPSEPDAAREDPPDVDAPAPGGRLAALPQGPLPGLLSREAWARAFALEERRLARYERPCAVVAIGLDGVEALSLRIGAEGAERLIEPLVATLAGRARAADLVCRIDRTRFVVLLPETDEAGARAYAARVAGATQPWLGAAPVPVRLSIGWGSPALGGTLASALVSAERRMNADRPELQGRPPGPQASSRRSAAQATGSSSGGGTVAP
jgi:GGDEF domain-containing protein